VRTKFLLLSIQNFNALDHHRHTAGFTDVAIGATGDEQDGSQFALLE
jgi:hypothetical protein